MKNASKITIAVLMAATLCVSGCGSNKATESGNASNQAASTTTTAANTEEVVQSVADNGFDIESYIANYTPKTELTNKGVFDYEVKVNGAVLTCPISTAELAALGYETAKPYTITLTPNELSEVRYDSRYYVHKDTGLSLLLTQLSTTSDAPVEFDSNHPRDDVLFYDVDVNYNERTNRNVSFDVEFYGGTINKTTENELSDKCGKFDDTKNLIRAYFEYPNADKPYNNSASFVIEEKKLLAIGFNRTPDNVK